MAAMLTFVPFGSGGGGGGSSVSFTATMGAGVVVGDYVYISAANTASRANAAALATSKTTVGVVTAVDTPVAGQCTVQVSGVALNVFAGLTPGANYLLGAAVGSVVADTDTGNANYPDQTPGSGEVYLPVGVALTATDMIVGVSRTPLVS